MQMLDVCLASGSPHYSAHGAARLTAWTFRLMLVLLTTNPLATQVTLAWSPSPSAGVDGHLLYYGTLYYGTQSGAYTVSLDVGPVTTTTVTGLSSGQTYYFAVTAYNRTDGIESAVSNEVSTTLPLSSADLHAKRLRVQDSCIRLLQILNSRQHDTVARKFWVGQ
jgi:hypothetical protein